jgi:hypothetical protein
MNHEEIIAGFPGFAATFRSECGLILCNDVERHRFVELGEAPAYSLSLFDYDSDGIEQFCSAGGYRKACAKTLGDEVAGCLTNFFFTARERFEALPWKGEMPAGHKPGSRILFYSLVCKKEEATRIEEALRVLCSKAGLLRDFGSYVRTTNLANHVVFSMNIAVFNHLAQPALFALRCGFESGLKFKAGKKENVIGKFNADGWVTPTGNLFHPDRMTKEQIERWSG